MTQCAKWSAEHPLLSRADFSRFVLEYLVFANNYLELRTNRLGTPMALKSSLAKYTRVGVERDQYWFVTNAREPHAFPQGAVYHLYESDLNQEIYGLPEYLSALNSTLLNESAMLFRRRYYKSGSHAGFILYMTDAAENQEDVDNLRSALKNAKGPHLPAKTNGFLCTHAPGARGRPERAARRSAGRFFYAVLCALVMQARRGHCRSGSFAVL